MSFEGIWDSTWMDDTGTTSSNGKTHSSKFNAIRKSMSAAESKSETAVAGRNSDAGVGSGFGDGKSERDRSVGQIDRARLLYLLRDLQRIANLQKQAVNAEIDARQKRREIKFKREAIWACDDRFMREVQSLSVREDLKRFGKLMELARECQLARDNIGDLEEEGNEADQHWEGQIWQLREAENAIYDEYQAEFQDAERCSPITPSELSGYYGSSGSDGDLEIFTDGSRDHGHQVYRTADSGASSSYSPVAHLPTQVPEYGLAFTQDSMLLGLTQLEADSDLDSGFGDIDIDDQEWRPGDLIGPRQINPSRPRSSIEPHAELLTDFGTRRDRITKWILHAVIISRHEANLLKNKLDKEIPTTPSNWAQLVIAYWETDGANRPATQESPKSASSPNENTPSNMKLLVDSPTNSSAAQTKYNVTPSKSPISSITEHTHIKDLAHHSLSQIQSHSHNGRLLPGPFRSTTWPTSDFRSLNRIVSCHSPSLRGCPITPSPSPRSGSDNGDKEQKI